MTRLRIVVVAALLGLCGLISQGGTAYGSTLSSSSHGSGGWDVVGSRQLPTTVQGKSTCTGSDRYHIHHSGVIGEVLYKYHTEIRWCYSSGKITSISSDSYFTDFDAAWKAGRQVHNQRTKISAGKYRVFTQDHACLSIPGKGCVENTYPYNKVYVYASHKTSLYSYGD